ncbi:MAG: hypothetical protein J5I93_16105 [Pirellulaceae bacterium]|nr:hypothetical protein [Pirellulaceae bacterium]
MKLKTGLLLASTCGLLTLLPVLQALGQDQPAPDVQEHAATLARAHEALRMGDREAAAAALDAVPDDLRDAPYRILRQLSATSDPKTGLTGTSLPRPELRYAMAALHPTRPLVAYVCDLGIVLLYDLNDPASEPRKIVSSRQKPLLRGGFSLDGHSFVAGDTEGGAILWETESWQEVATLVKAGGPVRNVAVNHDGTRMLAETREGVVLWDPQAEREIATVGKRYNIGTALCFSDDGRYCATGGLHSIVICMAHDGQVVREIQHAPYTMHLAFSADGKHVASGLRGSLNKWLGVFDVATGETVFDRAPHDQGITGLEFVDEGTRLLSTSADGTLKFWHLPSGQQLLALNMGASIFLPSVSRDGQRILWNQRSGPRYLSAAR